jgi:hypothetical protein
MALTALKHTNLLDKGFDELYSDHDDLWLAKAQDAYDYAGLLVAPTGEPVRPDDVLVILDPAVELSPEFRTHMDEKRLTQKYWKTYFSEFILDLVWEALTNDAEAG